MISEYLYTVGSERYQDSLKRPVVELAADMRLIGGPSELQKPSFNRNSRTIASIQGVYNYYNLEYNN